MQILRHGGFQTLLMKMKMKMKTLVAGLFALIVCGGHNEHCRTRKTLATERAKILTLSMIMVAFSEVQWNRVSQVKVVKFE